MQDKIKYIVLGVAAFIVLIVMMFLGLKVKSLEKERQDLQGQATALNEKITLTSADNAKLQDKIGSLSKDLKDVTAKRADVQQKYDLLAQERDALNKQISQIKEDQISKFKEAAVPVAPVPAAKPTMDDSYFAGILKQKADLEVQVSMMRDTLKNLKSANDQLVLEKNNLVYEINNMNRDTQDVKHTADYNQKMVDNLTQALASEKTNNLELAKRLRAAKADNRQIRQQLQSIGERRLSLEQKVADMQSKNAGLESSLASMELYVKQQMFQMDDIKNQMEDARGSRSVSASGAAPAQSPYQQAAAGRSRRDAIQLPPIVVRPQQPVAADAPSVGDKSRVISIDKENNFVVVNAGQADNVKIGDMFQVYRDGQNIGSVEVIQARDRISACDIKNETTPLRVGDLIRL
jgi:septal ring factor EnvC (AmiA/AmiB activator)